MPLPLDSKLHEARNSVFIHCCISRSFIVPGTYQILNKHWFSQSIQLSLNFFHLFSVFKWIQVSHNVNLHYYEPENDNSFSTCFHHLKVLRIILGEGNGTPLQYSCLGNPMDRGAWWAAVHGVSKSWTRLSNFTFMYWRRQWQPTPVFLPGESQGRGSLVGCRLWGRTESDTTEAT